MKKIFMLLPLLSVFIIPNYSKADFNTFDNKGKPITVIESTIVDDIRSDTSEYIGKYYSVDEQMHGPIVTAEFKISKDKTELLITETQHAGLPANKDGDTIGGYEVKYNIAKHGKLNIDKNNFKYTETLYDGQKRTCSGKFVVYKYKGKIGKPKTVKGLVLITPSGKYASVFQKL